MDFYDFRHEISRFRPDARPEDINLEFVYLFPDISKCASVFRIENTELKIRIYWLTVN